MWFTTQPIEEPGDPQHLLWTIEQARLEDRLLFATDYPHWDFDSPKQALPRAMGASMRRAILCENALELYGLPPGAARVTDVIDCDVHCAPESFDALFPYLSDYWRQYITEAGIRLNGLAHAYPRGVAAPAPSSYEALAEHVPDARHRSSTA